MSSLICKYIYLMKWIESLTFGDKVNMPKRFTFGDLALMTLMFLVDLLLIVWWIVPLRWLLSKKTFHCRDGGNIR